MGGWEPLAYFSLKSLDVIVSKKAHTDRRGSPLEIRFEHDVESSGSGSTTAIPTRTSTHTANTNVNDVKKSA